MTKKQEKAALARIRQTTAEINRIEAQISRLMRRSERLRAYRVSIEARIMGPDPRGEF